VEGKDKEGLSFNDAGTLENLSSRGAFLYLQRSLEVGTKLQISIRLPADEEKWMNYWAEVIRVEGECPKVGTAMRFTTVRPRANLT
jgi:hypothetical protein